jgi:hypothetical protein
MAGVNDGTHHGQTHFCTIHPWLRCWGAAIGMTAKAAEAMTLVAPRSAPPLPRGVWIEQAQYWGGDDEDWHHRRRWRSDEDDDGEDDDDD